MQLAHQGTSGSHPVLAVDAFSLRFESGEFRHSLIVGSRLAPTAWAPRRIAELDEPMIEALLAHEPALILLGTGERLVFPPAAVLAVARRRGIGIEVMDNRAAARTYNVLLSEERDVLLACLLDGD